jgi:hypothetical protein
VIDALAGALWRGWGRRWPVWAAAVAIAFGCGILYFLIAGLMTPDLVPAATQSKIVISGISGQGLREGHTSWRFAARRSEFSPDGAQQTYHAATATYYLRGKATYKIVAALVTIDAHTLDYSASQGVRVWSIGLPDKQRFITDALHWNNAAQTLVCPGRTALLYHGLAINTDHLSANLVTGMVTLGRSKADVGTPAPIPISTNRSP